MKLKWYWHIHHDLLCEPLTEPLKNRIKYIKENKPEHEIKLRLKLLKSVKGKIPARVEKAGAALNKARAAYYKAEAALDKARAALDKAIKNSKALLNLHKKECGCAWDGKTIFIKGNLGQKEVKNE